MNGHIIYATKLSTDIERLQTVAENEHLGKKDLRVFIFLCCRVGSKYYTRVDKAQVAESLCMSKKDVEKALDNLEFYNIIVKGSDEHVKRGYRMCYTGNDNL